MEGVSLMHEHVCTCAHNYVNFLKSPKHGTRTVTDYMNVVSKK